MKKSEIKIKNTGNITTIDIEGTIGVPEEWQFDDPAGRVATYEKFGRTLEAISRIRNGEIVVNIRSTGGDVGDALLIHDALVASGALITTRCYGYVASAATIIAQAAGDGRREISSSALYLIHNAVGSCEGNARDLLRSQELLAKTDERIASIYATRSGRPVEGFVTLMEANNGNGRWLSPAETLDEGLADRIVEGERQGRRRPMASNSATADILRHGQDIELGRLRHRVSALESENAQLRAQPTKLKSREDPAPTESRRSANDSAYQRDAQKLPR